MENESLDIAELHWLLGIIQHLDVGVVVLDRDYRIKLWNGFMENHSGLTLNSAAGKRLYELFDEVDEAWLRRKVDSVFMLNTPAFSSWQQRPCIIRFDSYRPITGGSAFMYQDMNIFPLRSVTGEVELVCLMLYDATDVALEEQALNEANEELARLGRTDGLTGLYNRRAWEEMLGHEYKRHLRSGRKSVVVMLDIDHFKQVNDTYGHQAGDEVIRAVAQLLNQIKRETDIAGRYGGEEYAVILPDTDRQGGMRFAQRLRQAVESKPVVYGGQTIRFTISLGLAELGDRDIGYRQWLEQADQALYRAKEAGRNRAVLHGE